MKVDLNSLNITGKIMCPWCEYYNTYVYGATGKSSFPCGRCKRMVLWDFDSIKGYKATIRKQCK